MPLVSLRCSSKVSHELKQLLAMNLPLLVAGALHVEEVLDAHLLPPHVEVAVSDVGPYDVNSSDIGVMITANMYTERTADIDRRVHAIALGLRRLLNEDGRHDFKGYVWCPPWPGGYVEL